ncbi:MAG: phosphodiesterase [Burkholderiaceae bacterium]|nr:phosphodiesterase [Burkholderiaceae bacterium]
MLIAQLSDLHIRPRGQLYKGLVDSNAMFAQAIAHLHGLDRRPDLVLISGDLVDEGDVDEYTMLAELLQPLQLPLLLMPGNHDSRDALRQAFAGHHYLPAHGPLHWCDDRHALRIVALDSCVPGQHHGHIDAQGLDWLARTLAADRHKPTLVLLHHPPLVSGIAYLDEYRCFGEQALAEVITSAGNVEAVLCGHVHRAMFRRWAGTVLASCPSTTTQIALQLRADARPQSYAGPAACLLHLWQPGEGLVSHVSHIGPQPGPYPFF